MIKDNVFGPDTDSSDVAAAVTRDGYAVVRDAIDADTLAAVTADISHTARGPARYYHVDTD